MEARMKVIEFPPRGGDVPAELKAKAERPTLRTVEGKELAEREFQPLQWAVPGILPEGVTLLAGAPKVGKALRNGTDIPTPDGWAKIEDLKPGDYVLAQDGSATRVVWSKTWERRPVWRLFFDNGTHVDADENHEWFTYSHIDGPGIRETKEIVNTINVKDKKKRRQRTNHCIPISAVLGKEQELEVDPYMLGVWLSDGTRGTGDITTGDVNVFDEFDVDVRKQAWNRHGYSCYGLVTKLKRCGVATEKHIPNKYLRASFDQRLNLIQGMMDSDGHITKRGTCEFCVTNKRLADDFIELARSLGIKAHAHDGDAKLNGRLVGRRYRVMFRTSLPVFRLSRKYDRQTPVGPRVSSLRITGALFLGLQDTTCIQIEHDSHIFLCGDGFIPTHNSWAALDIAIAIAAGGYVFGSIQVDPGESLYLALEDNERRMNSRLKKALRGGDCPEGLHIATSAPRVDEGLIDALREFCDAHPDLRLIIVDTIKPVRPLEKKQERIYDADYAVGRPFLALAAEKHVSVLLIHHTNKTKSEDELDTISGSTGLAGGVDNILVLKRGRGSAEAVLYVTGRDIEREGRWPMTWDNNSAMWMLGDESPAVGMSPERKRVYEIIRSKGPILGENLFSLVYVGLAYSTKHKEYKALRKLLGLLRRGGFIDFDDQKRFYAKCR